MTPTVLRCPHCGAEEGRVFICAPATVTTIQVVNAEVDLAVDLAPGNVLADRRGARTLTMFRLDDQLEVLDRGVDHGSLEIDDATALAFCAACNGDVTEQWKVLLDGVEGRIL